MFIEVHLQDRQEQCTSILNTIALLFWSAKHCGLYLVGHWIFFFTPIIFLSSVLGWVSDMRAVWSFGVLLFNDLLGTSGALLSAGLITPHYWGKTCLLVLPIPYELWVFQSGWTEQGLFPGLCECWALSFSPSSPHLPPWASPSPLYSLPHHPSLQ